jgi:hypothetical protein
VQVRRRDQRQRVRTRQRPEQLDVREPAVAHLPFQCRSRRPIAKHDDQDLGHVANAVRELGKDRHVLSEPDVAGVHHDEPLAPSVIGADPSRRPGVELPAVGPGRDEFKLAGVDALRVQPLTHVAADDDDPSGSGAHEAVEPMPRPLEHRVAKPSEGDRGVREHVVADDHELGPMARRRQYSDEAEERRVRQRHDHVRTLATAGLDRGHAHEREVVRQPPSDGAMTEAR